MATPLAKLKVQIIKSSRLYGFTLNRYLVEIFADLDQNERDEAMEHVWSSLARQKCGVGQITRQQCEQAVLECTGQGKDGSVKLFDVIGAFDVPKYVYDRDRQKFLKKECQVISDSSDDLADVYRNRYNCIYQRLLRNPLFSQKKSSASGERDKTKFKLKSLEALYGSNVLHEDITIFGMITQLKPDVWFLEDLNGAVELDLSNAEYRPGLICDSAFVLCEGTYENDIFRVAGISLPPPEEAALTRAQFGDINFFGGSLTTCAAVNKTLQSKERENPDAFMVFLSSVYLDSPDVMGKINTLLMGYSDTPPVAIVMCGPFLSPGVRSDPHTATSEAFKSLAKLISSHESLKEKTHFVFVPSIDDIGCQSVYPRPPLPHSISASFCKQVKKAVFTTNPCRLQYCTKEIVIFRDDLIPRMFRCRVNNPRDDLPMHFTRTLLSCGSLALLPHSTMPIFWSLDHAMSFFPMPDMVIVADSYYPYTESYAGCTVVNPGSFPSTKYSFKVYYPSTNDVEDSQIPNE